MKTTPLFLALALTACAPERYYVAETVEVAPGDFGQVLVHCEYEDDIVVSGACRASGDVFWRYTGPTEVEADSATHWSCGGQNAEDRIIVMRAFAWCE